jgi:hypothetical protein
MAVPLRVVDIGHRVRVPQLIVSFNPYSRHILRAFEQLLEPLWKHDVTSERPQTDTELKRVWAGDGLQRQSNTPQAIPSGATWRPADGQSLIESDPCPSRCGRRRNPENGAESKYLELAYSP